MVADSMGERDEVTLSVLSLIDRTTVAEQRRRALRAYAEQAREDPQVAGIVRLVLASRRERRNGGGNVIALRGGPVA
jgi:hypothetical protein